MKVSTGIPLPSSAISQVDPRPASPATQPAVGPATDDAAKDVGAPPHPCQTMWRAAGAMAAALTGWLTAPYGVRWESTVNPDEQAKAFVPDEFDVPRELTTPQFRLEPLGPEHNEEDYEAW